jgi:hypothetical protein
MSISNGDIMSTDGIVFGCVIVGLVLILLGMTGSDESDGPSSLFPKPRMFKFSGVLLIVAAAYFVT